MRNASALGSWLARFAAAYVAYMLVAVIIHGWLRGIADDGATRIYSVPAVSEPFFGEPLSMRLQEWLGTDHPVLVPAVLGVWSSLFWVTPLLALIAFLLGGSSSFYRLLAVHALVVFIADLIFVLVPTRPPWMDIEVTRIIAEHTGGVTRVDPNPYAALPSLHVGVPAAYAIWFWRQEDRRLHAMGPVLMLWTAALAFTVVYTGEHYVLCVAQGVLLALGVNLMLERVRFREIRPWAAAQRVAPAYARESGQ